MRFYSCPHCGKVIGVIHETAVPTICCGSPMVELTPNTQEAATEKHLPVITLDGNLVKITVGSVEHPMTEAHSIEWVYLETAEGGQRKALKPGDKPELTFALAPSDKLVAAYAYCNLHGLWKTEA